MAGAPLRVIDFGRVSPLRSQTLWHAIAHGVSAGAPPTLSMMQPAEPYVSIGYHVPYEEIDHERCSAAGLPVYRRMVGGGPVYLDDGQIFFQITVPVRETPAVRSAAVAALLEPAVRAFRAVGIDAVLEDHGDIVAGGRKVCGHGAGQIEAAVTVVGNLITRFDHAAAASVVRSPDAETGVELERLMRRHVAATPADPEAFRNAAVAEYARALDRIPEQSHLTSGELDTLAELDERFTDPAWVEEPARRRGTTWRVKIKSGVWMFAAAAGETRAALSIVDGRIEWARFTDPMLNGAAAAMERSCRGRSLEEAGSVLCLRGEPGVRLAALLGDVEREIRR